MMKNENILEAIADLIEANQKMESAIDKLFLLTIEAGNYADIENGTFREMKRAAEIMSKY